MAKLGGQVQDVFRAAVAPEPLRRHWVDVAAIAAANADLSRWERVDDQTVRLVLATQKHGPTSFTPDFVVRYRLYGDDEVVWETVHGNMISEGRARFAPRADGGTDVHYSHAISLDLPVPGLLARALQPVATALLEPGIRSFVAAMIASAPKG